MQITSKKIVLHFILNRKGAENLRWKKTNTENKHLLSWTNLLNSPLHIQVNGFGGIGGGAGSHVDLPSPLLGSDWEPKLGTELMNSMKSREPVSFLRPQHRNRQAEHTFFIILIRMKKDNDRRRYYTLIPAEQILFICWYILSQCHFYATYSGAVS